MRKTTTFLALLIAFGFGLNAQNISFESSEGYTLGDINGQDNWGVTGDDAGGFIKNQHIVEGEATDGLNSLKLVQETEFPGQPDPHVGAFYTYPTPISNESSSFSADIYISDQGFTSFRSIMALVNVQEMKYHTYVDFFYNGDINVFSKGGPTGILWEATGATWEIRTWFNIRIETFGNAVIFYKDDVKIYEGMLLNPGPIEQVRFVHDNYAGFMHIDNFRTNEIAVSTPNIRTEPEFTHFYNKFTQALTLRSLNASFDNISIYNVMGQNVINKGQAQNNATIDMSALTDGVYIVKFNVGNVTKTFKVVKE